MEALPQPLLQARAVVPHALCGARCHERRGCQVRSLLGSISAACFRAC